MTKKHNKHTFEENYFEGYYQGIGDFSDKRNKELENWFKGMLKYLERHYPIYNGKRKKLIEFGCATGVASRLFQSLGYSVTATDVSKYAIFHAKKNFKNINFHVHDMQKPYPKKNQFDIAVAFDVVEHLEKPELAIKHVYNMLRDKGVFILSTPNDYKHISNDPTHISVKVPGEWEKIVRKAGFKIELLQQVTFIPYLYRFHWRLNYAFPFPVLSPYFISPVFIIARKDKNFKQQL